MIQVRKVLTTSFHLDLTLLSRNKSFRSQRQLELGHARHGDKNPAGERKVMLVFNVDASLARRGQSRQ